MKAKHLTVRAFYFTIKSFFSHFFLENYAPDACSIRQMWTKIERIMEYSEE